MTWYDIKIQVDVLANTYDLYVNGNLMVSAVSFNQVVSDISKVSIGETHGGTIYMDNFYMYRDADVADSFNDEATGVAPTGWSMVGAGSVTVQEVPSLSDKSANIVDGIAKHSILDRTGKLVVSFRARPAQTNKWIELPTISNNNGLRAVQVALDQFAQIKYLNGASWTTVSNFSYQSERWYDIQIVLDTNTQKYDLYINDQLQASNASFSNSVSQISSIQSGATNGGSIYLDQVYVMR